MVRPSIDTVARRQLRRPVEHHRATLRTVYHLALSADPQQRYVFVADGTNNMVWIYNRNDGTLAGSFGGNGRYAGNCTGLMRSRSIRRATCIPAKSRTGNEFRGSYPSIDYWSVRAGFRSVRTGSSKTRPSSRYRDRSTRFDGGSWRRCVRGGGRE